MTQPGYYGSYGQELILQEIAKASNKHLHEYETSVYFKEFNIPYPQFQVAIWLPGAALIILMEDQVCTTVAEGLKIMKKTQEVGKYLHPCILRVISK